MYYRILFRHKNVFAEYLMAWSKAFSTLSSNAKKKTWALSRKHIVQQYSMILLEVITERRNSDEFLFRSIFQLIYNTHLVTSDFQKILTLTLKEETPATMRGFVCLFHQRSLFEKYSPTTSAIMKTKHIPEAAQSFHLAYCCSFALFSAALELPWQW